ncbi:hypothetical protein WK76_24860 [Burkholderia ubonensis]|uniref:hypothetical protein n=1 Tax=Burkholderia ubonensis TaxID=101571 RepID=UPI0007560BFE|nr:hypothetical protein [Burkholderia ubonensis]KVU84263.1 hypothetical protein WK76_24860 [Burkholderia ubonensis]
MKNSLCIVPPATSVAPDFPVVALEAIRWTGKNLLDVVTFLDGAAPGQDGPFSAMLWQQYARWVAECGLKLFMEEVTLHVNPGDWIVKSDRGQFFVCKRDMHSVLNDVGH